MISRRGSIPRRRVAIALLLAVLLLATDTLAWLQMQRLLDHRLRLLVQDAARSGWQFEAASEHRGGWPLRAELVLDAPRLQGGGGRQGGDIVWSGERITASVSPLHPGALSIAATGTQTLSAADATRPGSTLGNSVRFWGGLRLRLPADAANGTGRAGFDAAALHVAFPGAGPDDVVTIAGLRGTVRWTRQARALTLDLRGVALPRRRGVAAGPMIPAAALELSLIGPLAGGVDSWRAGGGRVLLRQAAATWSDGGIEASGQAMLDGNLRPDGSFIVQITGANAMLDRLAQSGWIEPSAASAVRAVLGLIAAARGDPQAATGGNPQAATGGDPQAAARGDPQAAGSRRPLELPLTLRGGLLSLGQIPLLRVPSPMAVLP